MKNRKVFILIVFMIMAAGCFAQTGISTAKPWTFWFWMGSAVNQKDIKTQLTQFSGAGFGGVHIVPVYGVKGYENQFIPFLSERWMETVQYTIKVAAELNLGVDVSLCTGWPYGGNWIDSRHAAKKLTIREFRMKSGGTISFNTDTLIQNNRFLQLIGLMASNDRGEQINLGPRLSEKTINLDVSPGNWKVTAIGITNTNQKVKRAAPGGEGPVMDYFDREAVSVYLHHFDSVFASTKFPVKPRAWFHDSYETYQANWSFVFPKRFREMHGYDFTEAMPLLMDTLNPERPLVVHDFRETLSDLLYTEFAVTWTSWVTGSGSVSRYQAHGSPGNLLDLYALSDIPETESFGCSNFLIPGLQCDPDYEESTFGRPSPLMMKFASSPAHILNKTLVSSETATWLAEHFKESLSKIKPQADELFVSGINHIIYQGSTYSPENETYPGWLFYASTNFGPGAHFWDELPLLNSYITESQNILQNSTPDNDILLYFPIDDLWTRFPGDLLLLLDVHKYSEWFGKSDFGRTSKLLWDNGFTFDYVSDKQIAGLSLNTAGKIYANPSSVYSAIVVPPVNYMNKTTLQKLESLAKKGARIIFMDKLPDNQAGYQAHKKPDPEFSNLKTELRKNAAISADLIGKLKSIPIRQEEIKIKGLDFIRKKNQDGTLYFISNLGNRFYADSIGLGEKSAFVELFDPLNLKKGYIKTPGKWYLQLPPGKSCFIRALNKKPASGPWQSTFDRDTLVLNGPWKVSFISGNNQGLKPEYLINKLTSWTGWGDDNLQSFCGKARYSSGFVLHNFDKSRNYRLVFEDIRETARVTINGNSYGTAWSLPYCIDIPANALKEINTIEITVQNLSANRMKETDTRKVPWKKFYDINFVDIRYKEFDASKWACVPSGLIGKVMLVTGSEKK